MVLAKNLQRTIRKCGHSGRSLEVPCAPLLSVMLRESTAFSTRNALECNRVQCSTVSYCCTVQYCTELRMFCTRGRVHCTVLICTSVHSTRAGGCSLHAVTRRERGGNSKPSSSLAGWPPWAHSWTRTCVGQGDVSTGRKEHTAIRQFGLMRICRVGKGQHWRRVAAHVLSSLNDNRWTGQHGKLHNMLSKLKNTTQSYFTFFISSPIPPSLLH